MLLSWLKKYPYLIALGLLLFIISLITIEPGTILSGWDTLHPEFNYWLNFKRLFFGVWRDEQGLGAVAGHSHMADLPRVFILLILDLFFKTNLVRYLFILGCLWVGVYGMYACTHYLWTRRNHPHASLVSFLVALFYLLNLNTIQQFYVPFEMFPVQYAALPWLIMLILQYLHHGSKKTLFWFSIATLLATPQAYAAHLWYAFFGVFLLFLTSYFLLHRTKTTAKRTALILIATFMMNSFWLIPNIYFIATGSDVPRDSKQNRLFSQEFLLRNREQGYITDVSLMKGFYFDWDVYDTESQSGVKLMQTWRDHTANPLVTILGYSYAVFVVLGVAGVLLKRDRLYLSLLPFLAIPIVLLLNHTQPFESFFNILIQLPVFKEAFRFIFTKVSILLLFGYSLYLGYAMAILIEERRRIRIWGSIAFVCSLIIFTYPIFLGQLISPYMKIRIPQRYGALNQFMAAQPQGTIVSLPLHSFSGWQYTTWGYQGAGFLWFDLPQPLLDRDFDRWNYHNEQAFRELQNALYRRDSGLFISYLQKYGIRYLVWDKAITTTEPQNKDQRLYTAEIQALLNELLEKGSVREKAMFEDNLLVYELTQAPAQAYTQEINRAVTPDYRWASSDYAYNTEGTYLNEALDTARSYPLRDLITVTDRIDPKRVEWNEKTQELELTTHNSQPFDFAQGKPTTYNLQPLNTERTIATQAYIQSLGGDEYKISFEPTLVGAPTITHTTIMPTGATQIAISDNVYPLPTEAERTLLGTVYLSTQFANYINAEPIDIAAYSQPFQLTTRQHTLIAAKGGIVFDKNELAKLNTGIDDVNLTDEGVEITALDTTNSITIPLPTSPHSLGYVIKIDSKNVEGLPIRLCMNNLLTGICAFYDETTNNQQPTTDYFLVPPLDDANGYNLILSTISYGNYDSTNLVNKVTVIPIQYDTLMSFSTGAQNPPNGELSELTVVLDEPHKKVFQLATAVKTTDTLVLNRAYHSGWGAVVADNWWSQQFPLLFGQPFGLHTIVNSWANAWKPTADFPAQTTVLLIFWPQYLQFIGYVLVIGWIGHFFITKSKTNNSSPTTHNHTPLPDHLQRVT